MALTHKAYLFDHQEFHRKLTKSIVVDDMVNVKLLHDLAQNAVENLSASTQQVLQYLRFDQDWLDTTDQETMRIHLWYLIALASELSVAPSLSNRSPGSYGVLQLILPLAGWDSFDVQELIVGLPLHTLLKTFKKGLPGFPQKALNTFGGWLSLDKAKASLIRLKSSENYFFPSATESIETLLNAANLVSARHIESPSERMKDAYADAIDMLQTSVTQGADIFMILD